jgi:hypothetical protein
MSGLKLNLIGDLNSTRPAGIISHKALTARDQIMYGRKDGATVGQHLDEFDSFRDGKGRSFNQIVLDELLPEPASCPKAQSAKTGTFIFKKAKVRAQNAKILYQNGEGRASMSQPATTSYDDGIVRKRPRTNAYFKA